MPPASWLLDLSMGVDRIEAEAALKGIVRGYAQDYESTKSQFLPTTVEWLYALRGNSLKTFSMHVSNIHNCRGLGRWILVRKFLRNMCVSITRFC